MPWAAHMSDVSPCRQHVATGAALTFVKPAVLETVERIEQGHVQEADQLADDIDGEQTHNHPLRKKRPVREGCSGLGAG